MPKAFVATSLLAAGVLAGVVVSGTLSRTETGHAAPPQAAVPRPAQPPAAGSTDLTVAAERALRSVANISSTNIVRQPLYGDIFGRRYYTQRQASSLGSGVLVSADGYVLTNAHVLRGGGTEMPIAVKVVLSDKRERDARVVGIDDETDLAVVKVEGTGLTPMTWGDSSQLRVAEWVMAIGNPFQLSQTVTMGIVSAVGRANLGLANYEDFIQTDAAINRGNSGGALINTRGELVGINTAIFSETGGYQGIGFAVPSNLARRVMDDLVQYGTVRRGSIGEVRFENLTEAVAADLGLRGQRGPFVYEMYEDSSAWQAGLRPGDLVVSFNGQRVADQGELTRLISDAQAGTTVRLGVQRGGRAIELEIPVTAGQTQSPRRRR
ncbi:MAG TPA: trypsin-like peptidase domain-containing protein [Vicinamibacterales bacterium]|nr:trypsin-like peptidase domain-containing protein [Vicinamibacterales bacterium]